MLCQVFFKKENGLYSVIYLLKFFRFSRALRNFEERIFVAFACWRLRSIFFCGSKKYVEAGSSVGIDQPTERSFCRFFCLKNEKIFLAKMRAIKKIFCGSKNFFGGEFWWNQKRVLPQSPLQGRFECFVSSEGGTKLLKRSYRER